MKQLQFGIEIETVGLSLQALARAVHSALPGSTIVYPGGASVADATGRVWKCVPDGSLNGHLNGEIVSPVLRYEDLESLQAIVRAVRAAGANADESCGIHVHVDGARFDASTATNLVKLVYRNEKLIEHALGVSERRLARYCRSISSDFIARLERSRPKTMSDLSTAWYGSSRHMPSRYDGSRYHGLNLNSLFFRRTVEFRYFNGSLHAGKVKAFVQLALAMSAHALTSKTTAGKRKEFNPDTAKYACRIFLKLLGLVGDEFKTVRHHLTSGLAGHCNYRGVAPQRAPRVQVEEAPAAEPEAEEVVDAAAE